MPEGIITISYLVAGILFILSLGGLSNQETARKGNIYGIVGMGIAILAPFQPGGQRSGMADSVDASCRCSGFWWQRGYR